MEVHFINHSTVLIKSKDANILTDPVWSKRVGPFGIGPKRYSDPGMKITDLPRIDYIVISHNHYDHLDICTLKSIKNIFPDLIVIVPSRVENLLYFNGFKKDQVVSLPWWKNFESKKAFFSCVPAKHFSGRYLFDKNSTLWAGFIIMVENFFIYFAGDTGFDQKMFESIASKFPSIDLSLIPIGAYKPRRFFNKVHMDPMQAVDTHKILRSKKSLGIHYGTFRLAFDSRQDSLDDLEHSLKSLNVPKKDFVTLDNGGFFTI